MPREQFVSCIMARTSYVSVRWWRSLLLRYGEMMTMPVATLRWDDDDACFLLNQHLDGFYNVSLLQSACRYVTHYPNSESTSLCSYSSMLTV